MSLTVRRTTDGTSWVVCEVEVSVDVDSTHATARIAELRAELRRRFTYEDQLG